MENRNFDKLSKYELILYRLAMLIVTFIALARLIITDLKHLIEFLN